MRTLRSLGIKLPTFETISVVGNRAKPTLHQSNGENKYVFNIIPRNVLKERIYGFAERVMSPIFHDDNVTMVPIINGAIRFYSELSQYVHEGSTVELMAVQATTYDSRKNPDETSVIDSMVIPEKIRGRTVVIIDDILDTGSTAAAVSRMNRST